MLSKLNKKVMDSKIIKLIYKVKTYFGIGVSQVSWFTGKLPEIMGAVYILEKFDIIIVPNMIIIFSIVLFAMITLVGYFLKKSGLWVQEKLITAQIDPIQDELLKAARKINKEK